ncbi:hypothetical protein RhiirA1_531135 [Rhizophagus irregularis]|uniref:Fe2OG dioxygenase domain-containing protein n=3 Tax=Rhizophagus irregularis TaxID=588596 RepID=A0A2N1MSY8_9GLOM|nr:hypothetical protein GLOIN_2v1772321 [Rhizophagus irregularis DAOM 181602=DAOM 197198]PKC72526.1 hypothetical protein RhiirA1_531135 [Rhizophagus irregularis]PKK64761.1 hypothetical protein RhiirC2_854076 [Rhizophagus irregularis]POG73657.1 hypothetical protein GLOIN_2v1772321 [Rhizophagus irregularis DAOM 181602=DAOM 197198]UZO06377.1 hypothetical protein OCT59_026702 [Rhizophagus irregularis]CAB4393692.1 unnamed protein product [Rhizophagus irregularis]|eukprot:XP_025180523.1 hypothetical protein GLOIN_2v1772321 [Rhizophagus irregularis DAOM 181602=DAOM 197198]
MEQIASSNVQVVQEEVKISVHPLPEDNDVTNKVTLHSPVNVHRPKVWAETRQELCETLAYFRAYQGGVYHKDNAVYAYLVDGFGAKRDVCNGRVIISHGGGKSIKQNDKYELAKSQSPTDNSVKSLLNNYYNKQPLAIIIGNKCSITKFKVPARYCVLGFYLITHAWAELEDGENLNDEEALNEDALIDEEALINNTPVAKTKKHKSKSKSKPFIRWKFRFEWIDTQEFFPWWEDPAEINKMDLDDPNSDNNENMEIDSDTCNTCKQQFFPIYNSWMCLESSCKSFWKIWNTVKMSWENAPQDLSFNPIFLVPGFISGEILSRPLPFSIIPSPPIGHNNIGAYSLMHWKGYHCLRCGRVSCRVKWSCWECMNCHKTLSALKTILDKSMLADPHRLVFTGPATDCEGSILNGSNITRDRTILSNGVILMKYNFPNDNRIFHFVSNEICNEMPDIFLKNFQEIDNEQLKRHPIKSKLETRLFARQFTLNVGEHYKFALELNTVPWKDAPKVCNDTLDYVKKIIENFVPEVSHDFNQMLVAIYMEGQRMSWHDDGEKGVGPIIVSLSLGSPAEMKVRRKLKKKVEASSSKSSKNDEKGDYTPTFPIMRRNGPELLLNLNHGDIVIMAGDTLQEHYDHMVAPKGFRVACTIRKIEK